MLSTNTPTNGFLEACVGRADDGEEMKQQREEQQQQQQQQRQEQRESEELQLQQDVSKKEGATAGGGVSAKSDGMKQQVCAQPVLIYGACLVFV